MKSRIFWIWAITGFFCTGQPLLAENFDLNNLDLKVLGGEFQTSNREIRGTWKDAQNWPGTFCHGHYDYRSSVTGNIEKIAFNITSEDTITVVARVEKIRARVSAGYRSELTLCESVRLGVPVFVDSVTLTSEVYFKQSEDPNLPPTIRVTIKDTEVGHISFGVALPTGFEDLLTSTVNATVSEVWRSQIGTWLNEKLTEEIRKNFPR